ncbi:MAG: hypothetical protein JSW47_11225 [Phycisphaerales bacterium]|nr:MAG: hypothetical protein JSW47_11225 [Phycisphaerales bacterium]
MIKFSCKSCGQKLTVDEKHSGKRIKCPKCGSAGVVPDSSDKIKFHCDSCGQSISVPQIHAGKKGKCPKCKTPIVVPSPKSAPARSAAPTPSTPSGADEDTYEDQSDLPGEGEGVDRRLILAICGAAAVVVVGIIILVTVILPSGSRPVEEPDVSPRQKVADAGSQSDSVVPDIQQTETSAPQPPKEDVTPKESTQSPVAASDEAGKLDLKLRLEPGQKHRLEIVKETDSSQTIEGRQIDEELTSTTGLEFEVVQVDTNGVTGLKITYLKIHEIIKTERGRREYDSTKPDVATNNRGGILFSAMIGQSFIAKVTTQGEIVELEGLDEMYQRMAEPIVKWLEEDSRRRAKERGLKATFAPIEERIESRKKYLEMHSRTGQRAIREMLGSVIVPFPREPVALGGSWQARSTLSMGGSTTIGLYDCTYNLREGKQESLLVDIGSKIELDDEPVPGGDGPGSARVTLTGSCQGSLEVNPSTGWLLHKNVTLNYSGKIKTPPTERSPQGRTWGMSMEIITTIKPME